MGLLYILFTFLFSSCNKKITSKVGEETKRVISCDLSGEYDPKKHKVIQILVDGAQQEGLEMDHLYLDGTSILKNYSTKGCFFFEKSKN